MPATPRGLKPEMRAIVEWAEPYGWTLDDRMDGQGHWVLRHTSGATVPLSATPGDWRGALNTKARIRRISGIPPDSGPAGKYRFKPHPRSARFDMERAVREQAEHREAAELEAARVQSETEELRERHQDLRRQLEACDPRREQRRTRQLAEKIIEVERRLKALENDN